MTTATTATAAPPPGPAHHTIRTQRKGPKRALLHVGERASTEATTVAAGEVLPVIVFGRDDKGKPHASRFEPADAPLAMKAAGIMGMQVLPVGSPEAAALAARLPAGRVFASGKGFVPFVRADLYDQLAAAPGAYQPEAPPATSLAGKAPGRPKGGSSAAAHSEGSQQPENPADGLGSAPAGWPELAVGSLALAAEEGAPAIWYVATVVSQRGDDLFELRWFEDDDGALPLIVRRREHLGLFPPALVGALR